MSWWTWRPRPSKAVRLAILEHNVHVLHEKERRTMATLTEVNARLTQLEADVANIPPQQPPQPAPAATEADLDGLVTRIDAIDAAVIAKSQPPTG